MAVFLTTVELASIRDGLSPRLSLADLTNLCAAAGTPLAQINLGSISGATLQSLILAALDHFNGSNRIEIFLDKVKGHFRVGLAVGAPDLDVVIMIDGFLKPPGAGPGPATDAIVVPPNVLFFNRRGLRQALTSFVDVMMNYRILIIHGPAASGKTHSYFLIDYVGRRQAGVDVVLQYLNDFFDETVEPFELMEAIAQKIGLDTTTMPRAARAQDARIVLKLVNWFVGMFAKRPRDSQAVWLVIDGFNLVGCPDWAYQFGYRLALEVAQRGALALKLVLIGVDPTRLDPTALTFACRDPAIHVTPSDVWDFVTNFASNHQLSLANVPRDVLLSGFFDGLPTPPDHAAAREIASRVTKWLNVIKPGVLP
jgi:hypothetical protein